jgi:hypothetical protein
VHAEGPEYPLVVAPRRCAPVHDVCLPASDPHRRRRPPLRRRGPGCGGFWDSGVWP